MNIHCTSSYIKKFTYQSALLRHLANKSETENRLRQRKVISNDYIRNWNCLLFSHEENTPKNSSVNRWSAMKASIKTYKIKLSSNLIAPHDKILISLFLIYVSAWDNINSNFSWNKADDEKRRPMLFIK